MSPLDDLRVEDWEDMIDVNIKGVLYGIAAAWPVFRRQGFGHFVNSASTAGLITVPTSPYIPAQSSPCAHFRGGGDKLRVTITSPGFVQTKLGDSMKNPEVKSPDSRHPRKMAIPPDVIARTIAFAIEQPANVDVNEIVVRPTAHG